MALAGRPMPMKRSMAVPMLSLRSSRRQASNCGAMPGGGVGLNGTGPISASTPSARTAAHRPAARIASDDERNGVAATAITTRISRAGGG